MKNKEKGLNNKESQGLEKSERSSMTFGKITITKT
jgi:hypothetical protein